MISESNLNRYRLFCAVAECESISRAAEINYISQPAISKAITKMEESLGTQLFVRNHRGVTLTDEGKAKSEREPSVAAVSSSSFLTTSSWRPTIASSYGSSHGSSRKISNFFSISISNLGLYYGLLTLLPRFLFLFSC